MAVVASQSRKAAKPTGAASGTATSFWLAVLAMVALVAVAYWPAVKDGFIWDDDLMLTHNAFVKAGDGLKYFWLSNKPTDFFPLTYTDLWFEWRLWGINAAGYHLTNILLHAANAVLLWRVLAELLERKGGRDSWFSPAWFAAALWAVHPVNAATVSWIAERKNTLAMLFALVSVLAYLRSERTDAKHQGRNYIIALVSFALSLLAKTAGVALPVVLLGIGWWQRGLKGRDILRTLPFFAISLAMGLVTIWFQNHHALSADFAQRDLLTRLAGIGWAIAFYVWKAILPIGLVPIYPQWTINATATAFLPDAALLGVVAILWLQQKRWGRAPFFILAGFVVMLLPVAGLVSVNYHKFSLVADHWQYFALPFATAAIAYGVAKVLRSVELRNGILGLALVLCIILANQQTRIFAADKIWTYTLEKNPNCWVAANNLGEDLVEKGRYDEALQYFRRALQMHPGYRHALTGVASTSLRLNKYNDAIPALEELVKADPDNFFVRYNLGSAFLYAGKPQQAVEQLQATLAIPDTNIKEDKQWSFDRGNNSTARAQVESRLGDGLMLVGKRDEAVKAYEAALNGSPDPATIHYRLAAVFSQNRDRAGARLHLREVLRIKPDMLDAANDLAWSLATDANASAEQKLEAKQLAVRAADQTKYGEPGILDTLAAALAGNGEFDDAVKYGTQAKDLAASKGDKQLVADLQKRVEKYAQKRAYTE